MSDVVSIAAGTVGEGDVFTRLTVVVPVRYIDARRRSYSLVRCECGTEKLVQPGMLLSGNTRSCGCLRRENMRVGHSRLPNDGSVINQLILRYRRSARLRGYDWNLPRELFDRLVRLPCAYCGEVGSNLKVTKNCRDGFRYNGLDRIESSRGYEPDNVVPCCRVCNIAKQDMGQAEFLAWAVRLARWSAA